MMQYKFDLSRFLTLCLRRWYWFVALVLGMAGYTFVKDYYTLPSYQIKTTLLFESSRSAGSGVFSTFNNYLGNYPVNDSYIITSYPIIRKAINQLDFKTSYMTEGKLSEMEIYGGVPFRIILDSTRQQQLPYYKKYQLKIHDDGTFAINIKDDNRNSKEQVIPANRWVLYDGFRFKLELLQKPDKQIISTKYSFFINTDENLIDSYKGRLSVEVSKYPSSIMTLTLTTDIPTKDQVFLDKLVEVYTDHSLANTTKAYKQTINFINDQLAIFGSTLGGVESRLETFKRGTNYAASSNKADALIGRIATMEEQRAQLILNSKLYDRFTELMSSAGEKDMLSSTLVQSLDGTLAALISKLNEKQTEKSALEEMGLMKNPRIDILDREIKKIKINILDNIVKLRLRDQITANNITMRSKQLEAELQALPQRERELVNIQRQYGLNEKVYLLLGEKKVEAQIAQAASLPNIKVLESATESPVRHLGPNKQTNLVRSIIMALIIVAGLLFAFDFFNNKINSRTELQQLTTIPLLGSILTNKEKKEVVMDNRARTAISESFRSVRSNLQFFKSEGPSSVYLITSSVPAEGKTFCAVNLAVAFAISGKKTVLITADMRRPKKQEELDSGEGTGLSEYLIGQSSYKNIAKRTSVENLCLITTGPIPPNPSELLLREEMQVLMENLRSEFDYIIIDSPPIGLVTDALILSAFADTLIYIVREGRTLKNSLSVAEELRANRQVKNLCVLLNDVKGKQAYAYGNGYGYYDDRTPSRSFFDRILKRKKAYV